MWKAKTIGVGLLIVWLSVRAIWGIEVSWYFICFVALAGVTATGLKWLKNVESRRFYRLLTLAITLLCMGTQSVAEAQQVNMSTLETYLSEGLGMIMLFAVPTGVVMIIRGIMMDRHDGAWKWEILKGLCLAGAPTIIDVLYTIFGLGQGGLTPSFQN
jgi:hypothetical protein